MTEKRRRHILLGLVVTVLAVGLYLWLRPESFIGWIKSKDTPIVNRMNSGAEYYEDGDYRRAANEYSEALRLAKEADSEAAIKWQNRIESISPSRRFFSGKESSLYQGGIFYFKNRMAEAAYGLASSIYQSLRDKYHLDLVRSEGAGTGYAGPPPEELQPAFEAIAVGLKASKQNESLRLLKAEICLSAGLYSEAIAVLENVLLIDNKSAEAYNMLGLVYSSPIFMQNSEAWDKYHKKSVQMFMKATEGTTIDGHQMPDPHFNLGMYYAAPPRPRSADSVPPMADVRKALLHLRKYLELAEKNDPNAVKAKKKIEELEKMEK